MTPFGYGISGAMLQFGYHVHRSYAPHGRGDFILDIAAYKNRVGVFNEDAIDFMEKEVESSSHEPIFVYIDPPYYKAGPSLYRHFYTNEDHRQLAMYIKDKRFPWLLSYDDVAEIRDLYNKEHCINLQLNYSVNSHRKEEELLISNMEIRGCL